MKSIAAMVTLMLIGWVPVAQAGSGSSPLIERSFAGQSKAELWAAVLASLRHNDIPVVAADFKRGKIRARQHNYLNGRWAACPNLDRRSFDPASPANLGVRSAPLYRGVDLRLEITKTATGTQLALDPRYYNVGRDDGRRAFAIQVRCRSTGVLEQTLFTAVSGP